MAKKILIIDDEVHIRSLLEHALEDLEDEGVELLFAKDGDEGLKMIKKEKPDLILAPIFHTISLVEFH